MNEMPRRAVLMAVIAAPIAWEPAMAFEQPAYTVLHEDGPIQVRAYAPMIVAEIMVASSEGAAPGDAFGPLFGYISGRNTQRAKIDMTAPVTQAPRAGGVTIDMTAPVTQTRAAPTPGEGGVAGEAVWAVAFIMPRTWTMETLPTPLDPNVRLREVPARTVASLRYPGRSRPAEQARKRAALTQWIADQGHAKLGDAEMAFYNAPYVPGPLRRNEILIPIAPPGAAVAP